MLRGLSIETQQTQNYDRYRFHNYLSYTIIFVESGACIKVDFAGKFLKNFW